MNPFYCLLCVWDGLHSDKPFFGHYVKSAKNLVSFFRYYQKFGKIEKTCLRQVFIDLTKFSVIPKKLTKFLANFYFVVRRRNMNRFYCWLCAYHIDNHIDKPFFGHYVKSAKNLVSFFRYYQKFGKIEKTCLRQVFIDLTKFSVIPKKLTKFLALFIHNDQKAGKFESNIGITDQKFGKFFRSYQKIGKIFFRQFWSILPKIC